jgi:hypothetical protein
MESIRLEKNFWENSLEHHKRQLGMSIAMGSSGLLLAGVGIGAAICGYPAEGAIAVGSGGAITYVGAKETIGDFQDYKEVNEKIAVREGLAKGMSMASSREH